MNIKITKNKRNHTPRILTENNKRTFGILAGLALTICSAILIFSGCEVASDSITNTDMADIDVAISKLDYTSITFENAEDENTVMSDFTLPLSGERETSISWESSNTDIVSIDQASAIVGSLKTGEASIEISLTATVSKGSAKQSKSFSITVLANENETPGTPRGLRIGTWAVDSLHLEWEEALPGRVNGEAGTITGYTVYYNTSDDFLDLAGLKSAHQYSELGPSTTTQITGLESGTQYYFAATASNAYGEGPLSPSVETHTDTPDDFVPDAPAIVGRSVGNEQVELTWTAPAVTGWKDGQVIAINGYNIYKDSKPITDTSVLTAVITNIEPDMRTWIISGLDNEAVYYFALSTLIGEDKESLPGGGDISVTPDENISTIRDILSLSVEDFTAVANESEQVIAVNITDTSPSELTYGTDYIISISKAGSGVEALVYNPETQEIDIADTIGPADAGRYTIRASGMGLYNEAVTDDFELTVKLSDTSLLEQARKALGYADIKFVANEDENSVYSDFTLPLTGLHGSSIAWKSDKSVVVISGEAAAVDPPDVNIVVVTLTAELYLNAENASKEFIIVLTHPPNTLPGAPESLAFTSWDTEAISLSWSTENTGYVDGSKASIRAYTVYYSETGDFSDLAALKNAGQYVEVSAAADSEAETKAIVSGLTSGGLYSFAVSASNSTGEGPLSSSIETHTNSSPDAPVIIGRSAADQQIVLTWAAPAISGWTDGHENIISSYDIYQAASAISDLSGLDVLETVNNVNPADLQSYTVTGLDNGSDYYFAIAAVIASGRSLPGGGDVSARPGDAITDLNTAGFTLSVEDAEASTNTPDQSIAVSLNDGGLSYGQDYSIAIIKGGRATTALSWDAAGKTIKASPTLTESDDGDYSIIASGMDAYSGNVSDSFILTVNLSDTDAVAAAQAALDISAEAGGDLNAVTVSQIALPIDGRYDTAISWESSDENVIRADGTVIIPAVGSQDAEVTLTAAISKNTANAQKAFNLIVKAPVNLKNTFPGDPIDLKASAWTDTSIELSWTAPDPGYVGGVSGSIRSYRVYYSESDDFSNLTGLDSSTGVTSTLTISNLSPGTLYYFAVSASNANGEGPVSPSVSTRTNSAPGTPGISARIAGDGQVGLNWLAPALSGWKDGQAAVIEHYEIYQSDTPISAISGMTAVYTTANAAEKSYTLTSLNNGQDYYFAVAAVTAGGKSAPGGGDAAVRPSDAITGLDTTQFALSIDSASIYTNSPGQFISVTLTEDGLIYGQDYAISISKGGASTTLLAWNAADGRIDVIETVTAVGADIWTAAASGMGTYSGIVEVDFELEVLLSDAEAVAAAAAALDIGEAVGGDADAVRDGFTLPLKGIEGTDIAWQSTDTNIAVGSGGTVTVSRPAAGDADAPVTLQATISKGIEQEEKSFMLTIKAYPDSGNAADTAPGEPFDLAFIAWTENSVELNWSTPDAGKVGGNPGTISGYTVYYSTNNDFADLAALKAAGQSIDTASTTATVGGLTSGQQYYFALSAVNAYGESSVSQSKTTRTNAAPGTPLISARNAGDGQVEIVWAAARSAGWINGTAAAIKEYEIYQSNSAIADLTGQTAIHTSSALARTYTIDALTNGESYYFAVAALSDINGRSAPGGGDVPVTPNDNLILLTSTQFALSIDNAAALTNTAEQIIAVNLNEDNLVYGQDYGITVSKAGTATTEIAWNPTNRQLDIVAVLSAAGTEHYTLTASGMGTYSGIIERSFELQISLSAADAVAAAKAALDIREAAGGDLDAVTVPQIALPLSGINGTDIEWTSNNPNVISANGTVSRPAVGAFDAAVILKASIRKDGEEAEKSFTLTVKAQKPSGPSTVPDAIGSIVLSEWSETSVRLDWTETHPGFIDGIRTSISAYTVYYNTSDDFSDLETLSNANRTVDAGTNLYAVIDGLESGKLYYFAVTASNTVGEGPVAQSVSTRTNSLPGRPLITGRIPGNEEVQLSWLVPASAGWKDGIQASIGSYQIYQDAKVIESVDLLSPVGSAQDMYYTASSLSNDQTYYFAVTTVNGHGEESLPAGGEVGISPTDIAPGSIKDDTSFLLSVEDAAAWTNTAGQTIDVDLDEDNLVYGQDYSIVISKTGSEVPELYYDSGIGKIRVSDALAASLAGDTTYTVTAHGMGSYKDSVTDDFVLTVSLSDADAVAADKRTLDISQEAGGNLNAVVIEHISLPANGPNGSSIAWTSSNPAVIADDGAVSRPSIGRADAVVELTASIRKNSASAARKFTLTVLALTGIANTAPGAPEDLQATPGELKVTLSWIAPKDRGSVRGQSASSLSYSVSGHETLDAAQSIPGMGGIRGTVVEVENLKANTEYSFYVRASNSGAQSTPATIDATALDSSNQIEITAISYTLSTLELMAGQTIEAISPALTPDTVKPEDPRLSFGISPTDFEAQTGLNFDENTGRISGTASLTTIPDAVSYTISVSPDTEYYKGTPETQISIQVQPILTASWNSITATAFTPGAFGRPNLDSDKWTGIFSAASLPDGLDINPITGEISGEPNGVYAAADYQIELTGRDDYFGVNSSAKINIEVNPKKLGDTGFFITDLSHSVVALTEDTAMLSIDNAGLTPTSDYTLSIAKEGSAAAALSIDNDGIISIGAGITASDAGVYTITATGQNDYTATVEGTFTLTVTSRALTHAMLGSISNPAADFEIQTGFTNPITRTLSFDGSLTIDNDYTLAITGRPQGAIESHVSLNSNTGELTLSTDIVPDDSGDYTITVSAAGNYTDPATPLTAAFRLTVTGTGIISITYSPVSAVYETAMALSASPAIDPADAAIGASFTISPELHTNTGLNFDPATGAISGTPTIRASGDYSVSIEGGDGTKYEGVTLTSASFSITIDRKPIEGTLSYGGSSIDTTYGTAQALSVQWTDELPGHTVTYAIAPTDSADPALPDDISFVESSGALSVSSTTAVHTGTYTITASGSGDYTGTKEAQVSIDVAPKDLIQSDLGGISAVYVSTGGSSPFVETLNFDGPRVLGDDYSVSITSYPDNAVQSRVTLTSTGELTIASGVLLSEAGEYTVTATGTGNYTGTATATFTLNVQTAALTSISYGGQPLAAVYNTAITDLTATVVPAAAADKVNFSIDPSLNSDTGLSFDTSSGRISGTPNKLLTQKAYTVTITGKTDTIYEGETKDVSIQVSVAPKDISDTAFAMTFDDKSDANKGAAASHSAASFETGGLIAAADYELSIAGPGGAAVPAVTIDNSGNISIGSGIDKSNTGEYSVTATGINNYTGTVGAAFTLTVRREITGISFTSSTLSLMPTQTMTTLTPTLTTGTGTQSDDDYIAYTISPNLNADTGLTFDTDTGTISGTATTESPSKTYTITVVPDAGHYTSTATATVDIEVTEALSATYSNIDATVNTAITTAGPTVNNANWEGKYSATLPGGLDINEDSGEINGTPTSIAAAAADYDVSLTGTGSYLGVDAAATVTITVNPKLITSVTYAEVHAALTVEITPSAPTVLPDGAKVRYALAQGVTLPGGLNLDPDSGAIEGTPEAGTNQDLTAYTILVSGTGDWLGSNKQATVKIKIDTAPEISASYDELSIRIRDTVDITYNSITPGETATFTMASGESLPAGLTLGQDGRITGTATSITGIKTYNIVLTGTGTSDGRSGTATVVITVEPKAITSVSYEDISAVYDTAITPVAPTKNPSGLTATYSSANLPTGLTVDSNGEISGQPTILQTTATESTITITGTGDWAGRSTTAALNITIGPKALSDVSGFTISGSGDVTALTGGSVTATVAGGLIPTSDYTLSIDKGGSSVAAVTINNAGNITIDSTITVNDTGNYTITATGQNNYTGDVTGTFALTVGQKALVQSDLGSITNAQSDFEITAGSGSDITRTLNFNGALAGGIGTDYTVGITAPSGAVASRVSLNSNTGELTISADIVPDDSGTYTVTATGDGNYKDTASATFVLTVTAASVSISYSSTTLTASYGEGIPTLTPTITPSGADINYSISPNLKTDTGLDFDTNTGEISGTPSSLLSTTKYTVSITGTDGTKYDGATDSFDVDVTVEQRDIAGTLTYSHIDTTYGEVLAVTPQWSGGLAGQTVAYTINPTPPSDIIFTTGTGALSVSNMTAVQTGSYTITATGTGNYKGTKTFDVQVTVSAKTLSAAGFSISGTETVTALTGGSATATVAGGLTHTSDYTLSISPNANGNISIDNDGTISIDAGITVSDAGNYTITATGQGNYSGTITGTFNLTVNPKTLTSALLGTINNPPADFDVSAGITSDHTKTLSFTGSLTIDEDYTLSITGRPTDATVSHVSLNSSTGVVTVTTDVVPDDAGVYTVEASGQGNYTDPVNPVTAAFTLTVTELDIISVTYNPVTAVYDTFMAAAAGPTVDPSDAAVSYSIDPDLNADTGLDFNTATGEISGTATSILSPKDYTVTIAGKDGTKYDGSSKTTTVSVTVNPKSLTDVSGFSVSAANHSTTVQTGGSHSATVNNGGLTPGSDYDLSITGSGVTSAAVSIDNSGSISITNAIALTHAGTYTVKASGKGRYTGELTDTFTLTVDKIPLAANDFSFQNTLTATAFTAEVISDIVTSSLTAATDYSLAITNWPGNANAVGIDNDGTISIDAGITVSDAGDYTITATGQGNYSGTVTGTFSLTVNPKELTSNLLGVIDNPSADFEVSAGITGNHIRTLSFDGTLSIGTDYSLVIKTRPQGATVSHVSLNSTTGVLIVTTDVVPDDAGVYTVEASGQGNYTDPVNPVTAAFTLTVTELDIISVTYNPVTAVYDTVMAAAAGPTVDPADAAATYSIDPNLNADTGLDFNTATGEISGTATSILSPKDYTVTIAGKDGTKYDGSSKTTTVSVTVNPKSLADVSGFSVSAANHSTTVQTGGSHSATVNNGGLTPGSDYDLSITGSGVTSAAVSIDNSGSISITNAIALTHAGTYTVKASGKGSYTGELTDTFSLTVDKIPLAANDFSFQNTLTATAFTAEVITDIVTSSLTADTDYSLAITNWPGNANAVSIDNDGTISIDAGIKVNDAGDYTITATGQGNYSGTITGTFSLTVNPKELTSNLLGVIDNPSADFEVSAGIAGNHIRTLSFDGTLSIGTDYSLVIKTRPQGATVSHVSLNSTTGVLIVTTDVVPDDAGVYTVEASGQGNYTDPVNPVTAAFTLTVTELDITSVTYNSVTAVYDTAMAAASGPTVDPSDAAVNYSINPNLHADTGLDFNTATGEISGTATSILSPKDYTVTIAGKDGTKYDGSSKTTTVSVTVNPKSLADVSGFSVSAANHSTTVQTGGSHSATVNNGGLTPGSDYDLSITGSGVASAAVSIDNSGSISITNAIALTHAGTYTVKASGKGSYTGELTDTFTLTVDKIPLAANDFSFQNTLTATAFTAEVITDIVTSSLTAATDYSLAITNWPGNANAVGIDNDGTISIDAGITVSDAGDYTITATGQGNYSGTVTGTFSLTVNPKELTSNLLGVIDNPSADFEVSAGITGNHIRTLSFDGTLSIGTDYSLVIKTRPQGATVSHVSLNSTTGVLIVTTDVVPDDAGVYTVEASGQGNYTDPVNPVTAAFTLTVTELDITSVTYNSVTAVYDTAMAAAAGPTVDPSDAAVNYSIDPNLHADTGLDFNTATGEISGTATSILNPKDYTVTIAGKDGTKYDGSSKTTTVSVTVNPKSLTDVSGFSVSAANHSTTVQTGGSHNAVLNNGGLTPGSDYDLSITGSGVTDAAVSIDNSGSISITNAIALTHAGTYTVKASGKGSYTGELTDTFSLTVDKIPLAANDFSFQNTLTATAFTAEVISGVVTSSLTAATDYSLAITNWPGNANAVGIDNDGTISIDAGITVSDAGDYTITATGQGNYSGTVTGTFSLTVNPKELTSALLGVIDNPSADFEVSAGITDNHIRTLSFDGTLSIGTDYSLVIKTRPQGATVSHVSLNSTTGVLIVTTDVVPDDAGVYTVEASGQGNYTDPVNPVTAAFTLTVTELDITSVTYNPVTAVYDTVMAAAVAPTVDPADAAVSYSIDPSLNADTGLDFNTATGEISGTATSILSPKDYTVTIAGADGTKYDGSSTDTTVNVTVNPKSLADVSGFSVSAANHSTTAKTSGSHSATVNNGGLTPGSDYDLSITGSGVTSGAVSINNSGNISITNAIASTDAGTYTVKASGKGSYTGESTDTFTLTVDKITLAANDFSFQNTAAATALTASEFSDLVTSTSLTAGTDYNLDIISRPNTPNADDVIINNDEKVSITDAITMSDNNGTYTVRATGKGSYEGTVDHVFTLTVTPKTLTADILGTIANPANDFVLTIGLTNNITKTLSFSGSLTIGTDFSLSLVGIPQNAASGRVTLSTTGLLTIDKDVVPDDSGIYTINAIGNNNYDGTVVLSLDITVNKIGISGTLGYADLEIGTGQTKKSNASWNNAADGQTVQYTLISPPSGVSIDENIGVVTVDASVVTADTTLTIRAEGTGLYTGEKTAALSIFIRNWIPSSASLTYSDIRVSTGSSETRSPQWAGGSYDVEYSMVPLAGGTLPNGINIDPSSGDITVSSSAAAQADTVYQVTATGTGSWKGWKKAEISISVYDNFYYEFQPALVGQTFSLSPINASSFEQFTPDSSLPPGLTLNSSSGEISGNPTTRQLAAEYTIEATPTGGGTVVAVKVSLFIQEQAANKNHLWQMIDEEITAQGNAADLGLIDTSIITDMSYLFDSYSGASNADYSAFNGDISSWDVSNVTAMQYMFYEANSFNGDISDWNVSGVGDMSYMFRKANLFNGDISSWNVSMVINMRGMFWEAAAFNSDLSNWDVSNVNDMGNMFYDADSFNGDISTWNVSNVLNMYYLFWGADSFNGDISAWNVSMLNSMTGMFFNAKSFNGDISGWDVSNVQSMSKMFYGASLFNSDLTAWNVAKVTTMYYMFYEADSFNGDISGWDVSSVANMQYTFCNTDSFNGDISGWDVSSVTSMEYMFFNAKSFNRNLSNWNVSSVTSMKSMFENAKLFNSDLSGWNVSNVTDMSSMFRNAESFNGNISGWNVSSVTNMTSMFMSASSFSVNLEPWSTTLRNDVTTNSMFYLSGLASNPPSWY